MYDGEWGGSGDILESVCPTTGEVLARVQSVRSQYAKTVDGLVDEGLQASPKELHTAISKSRDAYKEFRTVPAPRRGEILRQIRESLATRVGSFSSGDNSRLRLD